MQNDMLSTTSNFILEAPQNSPVCDFHCDTCEFMLIRKGQMFCRLIMQTTNGMGCGFHKPFADTGRRKKGGKYGKYHTR